ncbi:MAG: hypothetical protein AAFU41_12575 [Pseudomonadota bacterium]
MAVRHHQSEDTKSTKILLLRLSGFLPLHWHTAVVEGGRLTRFVNQMLCALGARVFLYLAILWVSVSAVMDANNLLCGTSMFQRSGAVLVAFALIESVAAERLMSGFPYNEYFGDDIHQFNQKLQRFKQVSIAFGFALTVLGTLIWAYGDFLLVGSPC